MKKILISLLAWFFLGQIPLAEFQKMDIDKFMEAVAISFAVENKCSSEIVALPKGENVHIFGRCQEIPEVDPDKIVGEKGVGDETDNVPISLYQTAS